MDTLGEEDCRVKMIKKNLFIFCFSTFLILAACSQKLTPPSLLDKSSLPQPQIAQGLTKAEWELDWESTIKAAKRERKVVIHSGSSPEIREAVRKAFEERFGITVESVPGATGQIAAKIIAEHRANIFDFDIYNAGAATFLTMLKPAGIVAPLSPVLVLPEVLDSKAWYGGKIPFIDEDNTIAISIMAPPGNFVINTFLVKPGEINSYQSLLDPKWKGKIILAYPARPPGGLTWFTAFVYSGTLNLDYMRALARQEPFMSQDRRQAAEWLVRGKYAISVGTAWTYFEEFYKAGMPVKSVDPLEGDYVSAGGAAIGLMKNAPHPNATKVFVNWFLSKEGVTVLSKAYDKHSMRVDVSTEGLTELRLRKPSIKYISIETEEFYLKASEYSKIAEEIFGPLMR